MTGLLNIYTASPGVTVTLVHDLKPDPSYTAVSVAQPDGSNMAVLGPLDLPDGNGATLTVQGRAFHGVLWMSRSNPANGSVSIDIDIFPDFKPRRPAPVRQAALPPFDTDPTGLNAVHTTLPPEQVIPQNPTRWFDRGDAFSITLDEDPQLITGAYSRYRMIMSFLASRYSRPTLDKYLTKTAERFYSHFHSDRYSWEWNGDGTGLSPAQAADYLEYILSWIAFVSYWGIGTVDVQGRAPFASWAECQQLYMPTLDALKAKGSSVCRKVNLIVGEELNSCTTPAGLLDIVQHLSPICGDLDIDLWLHFTSNYPAWPVSGGSVADKVAFWQQMHALNVKGLKWQSNAFDQTGVMGARMWDARSYMAQASPDLKCSAFETRGEAILADAPRPAGAAVPGPIDEDYCCLTGYELLCCTRLPGSNAPAVAGSMSGLRMPDGSAI